MTQNTHTCQSTMRRARVVVADDRALRSSSIYPQHPEKSRVICRVSPSELTVVDRLMVGASSLLLVGSVAWVPAFCVWVYKRWRVVKDKRKKRIYAALILSACCLVAFGPHRSESFGKWCKVRKWTLWKAWLRYIGFTVISDQYQHISAPQIKELDEKAILAFVPHGIFPFAFAFGALPETGERAFGIFRPVIATAANLLPLVRDVLSWLNPVDASRANVERALAHGDRIGIIPGGIAEIFEGYPKPNTHPDEEYAIVRKGFLRMAVRHGMPVIPIYCFGATKMMRRLQLSPLERLSLLLRISICIFYGVWGLPIPFRQRLLYVMGQPIQPPLSSLDNDSAVEEMHQNFCNELLRLFERHKEAYGWGHKTLKLLPR